MLLTDQVAIVTGGARGIGREIALAFTHEGADLALFDVNPEQLEQTTKELRALGRRAEGIVVDVTDGKQVDDGVAKVLDKLGRIDILINNAGITKDGLLIRMDDAQWDRVLNINLRGPSCAPGRLPSTCSSNGAAASSASPRSWGSLAIQGRRTTPHPRRALSG